MVAKQRLLVYFFMGAEYAGVVCQTMLTALDKQWILEQHNNVRASVSPAATDMAIMVSRI